MLVENSKIDKTDVSPVDDVENDVSLVDDVHNDVSPVNNLLNDVSPVNDVPNDFSNDVDNRTPSTATAVSLKDDDATIIRDDTQADNDHVIDGETTNNDVINVTSSIDDSDINDVNNDVSKSPNVVVGGITDDAGQNVTNTSPKSVEQSDCDLTTSSCDTSTPKNNDVIIKDDVSPGVPHRSKFAAGVTQFDAYYRETKSLGKFNKLKHLLRNSPRRQTKDQ
uniref:Uncharacterized protein n=1 Tax=Ciona savignyi TaxID=51511 RepID=H2ZQL3_CIOSA